jgi:uncharacterized protein (DUF1800 family)
VTQALPNPVLSNPRAARHLLPWLARDTKAVLTVAATVLLLAACGGGNGGSGADANTASANASADIKATATAAGTNKTSTGGAEKGGTGGTGGSARDVPGRAPEGPFSFTEASRFLNQATFGTNEFSAEILQKAGYNAWFDQQAALPATSHRAYWEAANAAAILADPANGRASDQEIYESFWKQALTGNDELRQRVAFALSQIFVVSLADSNVGNETRAVADWLDMLGKNSFGTYRQLLEDVTLHPIMGTYLNMLRNQKGDATSGRVPDENYSREVMQLFSIGLVKLNPDGTPALVAGRPVETYTPADISGLARVFTGFSYACANVSNSCFFNGNTGGATPVTDPDRWFKPMKGYPQFHSTQVKNFLGVSIPAQTTADPAASLKVALDTLANHPNTAPFISKQLIQRLVTSNPSPAYVLAVSNAFNNNGAGVRGDLKAVVKAVLMHPEARTATGNSGKLREPILRLSTYLRAFPHTSDTNRWRVGNTDSAANSLGQTVLRSPSVFNFFRPGYVPPGTLTSAAGLVAPEMQLLNETTASSWANFMRDNASNGVGIFNGTVNGVALNRRDLQRDWSYEMQLAPRSAELVTHILERLMLGNASSGLTGEIFTTVNKIVIPPLAANNSNLAAVNAAKRARINTAVLLTVASPEYLVQK